MAESETNAFWRNPFLLLSLGLILLFILSLVDILLILDNSVSQAAKNRLIALDAAYADGFFRRLYHKESLPRLSESIPRPEKCQYSWLRTERFITVAHALGPKLSAGPNSLPTMHYGQKLGFKFFEVDLTLTADGYLICYHGDADDDLDRLTYAQYLEKMHKAERPPCLFTDLVEVVRKTSNIWIILDVKNRFQEVYRQVKSEIGDRGLGKSFIPQIYSIDQLIKFREDQFFAGEIFTSYRSVITTRQLLDYARHFGIEAVTLTLTRFNEIKNNLPADLHILVHPVNNPLTAYQIRRAGARGIYTSYLTSKTFPDLFPEAVDGK